MFQTFISRHNSNFFSDKLVLTSVTPASSAPVLQTPKATSSTLYFDSLTVDRKSGSAGMPRPTSYAVFCLKKKTSTEGRAQRSNATETSAHGRRKSPQRERQAAAGRKQEGSK